MLDKNLVSIKPAAYEDIDELLRVCRILAEKDPDCPWTDTYPKRSTLMHDYGCGGLKKIMYGDKIAGIVSFGELGEFDKEFEPEPGLKVCDMARFGLLPEYHGSGLSVQIILMGQAMIKAENYDVARMFVTDAQPTLMALYEIMGFRKGAHLHHVVDGMNFAGYCYEKRREDLTEADVEITSEITTAKLSKDQPPKFVKI